MTARQTLLAHVLGDHKYRRQGNVPAPRNPTLVELQRWHRNEHYRYGSSLSHLHEHDNAGVLTGPDPRGGRRPSGWDTGERVVAR